MKHYHCAHCGCCPCKCYIPVPGPAGPQGAQGAPGPQGVPGPQGATGAPGSSPMLARGHFSLQSGTPPMVVSGGQNITFAQANAVQNLSFTAPGDTIGILASGSYRVGYGIIFSSSTQGRLLLRVNGMDILYTLLNVQAQPQGNVSATAILQLNAGDQLSLGVGGSSITLTTIANSAFLSVSQID